MFRFFLVFFPLLLLLREARHSLPLISTFTVIDEPILQLLFRRRFFYFHWLLDDFLCFCRLFCCRLFRRGFRLRYSFSLGSSAIHNRFGLGFCLRLGRWLRRNSLQ